MPKIEAPTVAEHRTNQEGALLAAAREILLRGGRAAVTPAAVGAATGLARSSIYKYFRSGEEILDRIVADAFAEWAATVRAAVEQAPDADARIEAYVRTSLGLAGSGAHRIAVLGGGVPRDEAARQRISRAHQDLAAPLRRALADRGDTDPELTAELVDGALGRAIDRLDAGLPLDRVLPHTLQFVHRALNLEE
ncbi:TetR/AcrR family transcriptional regulator [Nocardia sp. NPDC051030]|uniref:TetR/AcrR family transcriptional regulator n=1 Tax=Nocardia sp. NPDC051030 TaxID=3155162 RepID=UPI0034474145